MEENQINRRDFLRGLGMAGLGVLATTSPWLSAFSEVRETGKERCRLGIIGPGSRGQFLMGFLAKNPKADIVALADIYQPIKDFICVFQLGLEHTMNDSLAICRELFAEFWGQRLVNVMRALHDVKYRQLSHSSQEEEDSALYEDNCTEEELYEGLDMGDDE